MAEKEKKEKSSYVKNDLYKEVMDELTKRGFQITNPENVEFMVDEDNDDVIVDVNYMSSGIHYDKKKIKESDVTAAGFKWCVTWNWTTN